MKIILKILFFVIFVVNYYVVSKPSGYSNTKPYSYSFSTYHNVPSTSYGYLPPPITSSGYHSKHGYDRHGDGYDYPKPSIAFEDNLQQYPYNEYYSNYKDHDYNHQYYQPKQHLQQHNYHNYHNSYPTAVSYQSQTIWPSKSAVHKPSYAYKTYHNSHYPSTISNEWKPSYGAYGSYSNNGWYDEDTSSWNSGGWIK